MIIIKDLSDNENWTGHFGALNDPEKVLYLNSTDANTCINYGAFNTTTPTSSVFTLGTADLTNNATHDYIAYCFADEQGYSKFGSYTGNGSTDGTFVYTGFKPAFVM